MNTRTLRLALLSAGLSLTVAAHAAEPPATDDTATGYFAGVKVAIDPATGRLRAPTANEIRQLRETAGATYLGPNRPGAVMVRWPAGSLSAPPSAGRSVSDRSASSTAASTCRHCAR